MDIQNIRVKAEDISPEARAAYNLNKTNNLYVKISKKDGRTFEKIDTTNWPRLNKVCQFVYKCFSNTKYLYGEKAQNIMQKSMSKITGKAKFKRATQNAKRIGKGLVAMEKQGIQGIKLKEDYWTEAVSPVHESGPRRQMKIALWNAFCKENITVEEWENTPKGQAVLQEHLGTNYKELEMRTKYIDSPKNRESHKINFMKSEKNEVFLINKGEVFDTSNKATAFSKGSAIFVIDSSGEIYTGIHKLGAFHHSSFLGGGAVMGAGEIQTNSEGQIIGITNKSGHYRPNTEETLRMLQIFADKGVDLSKVTLSLLDKGVTCNAKEFLDSGGDITQSKEKEKIE